MISRIVLYCRKKYCNILQYQYIVASLVCGQNLATVGCVVAQSNFVIKSIVDIEAFNQSSLSLMYWTFISQGLDLLSNSLPLTQETKLKLKLARE